MKIYSMTATFGKLENQTLTFQPGLNVIHAPNEWGKTTWCAFLVNMLYGLETRTKSTKNALADKERYAPWSGSPMSGQICLNWNGRDITIERHTKGRTPLGVFRAFETDSGLDVPELTASNCGEMLWGVERSVFMRSGFLRLADLPVTEDEPLRRRLNALVTTGDESDTADQLKQRLKELKNKIRYNRFGLLPTAEKEAGELEDKLEQIHSLERQIDMVVQQRQDLKEKILALENHKAALEYAAAQENQRRIEHAQTHRDEAKKKLDGLKAECAGLPNQQQCAASAEQLRKLHGESMTLDMEQQMLPAMPEKPTAFGMVNAQQVANDAQEYNNLRTKRAQNHSILRIALCAGAVALVGLSLTVVAKIGLLAVMCAVLLVACAAAAGYAWHQKRTICLQMEKLAAIYGNTDTQMWCKNADDALAEDLRYTQTLAQYEQMQSQFRRKRETLNDRIRELTAGKSVSDCLQKWEKIAQQWTALTQAEREYENAKSHAEIVSAMARPAQKPEKEDTLNYSMEQTQLLLEQAKQQMQQLGQQQGQLQGRKETLGQEKQLQKQLEVAQRRIEQLIKTYDSLELAQSTLTEAGAELQRRFAPRISKDAQQIFERLTDGRYESMTIGQDLSLQTKAGGENVFHTALWRSEGTVDQMYLALRLAVSRALIPNAPLVLDDALVCFDDVRHQAAMKILKEEGQSRQIIFFSCQQRELLSE